jgi:predicted nucleic acid-binding protein
VAGSSFLDTNVLIYLHDVGEPAKQDVARRTFDGLDPGAVVLSTQVLQEFFWNATRKMEPPLSHEDAARFVLDFSRYRVVHVDPAMILSAIERLRRDRLAFWDALIVESALSAGCTRLLTEDLQDGRMFDSLRVENPFRP